MQRSGGRTLAAVLFTDMVDSTAIAEELGDRRWKALVHEHHRIVRRAIKRFGGTEHDTAGDGFFASFKEPASAIACACEATEAVRALGVEIRAGIHFGECEHMGKKLGGITVVVGARIMSLGGAGDVLVSSTAAELSRGAGFGFADRGMHRLKGVEDEWHVFAATAVDGKPRPDPLDATEARAAPRPDRAVGGPPEAARPRGDRRRRGRRGSGAGGSRRGPSPPEGAPGDRRRGRGGGRPVERSHHRAGAPRRRSERDRRGGGIGMGGARRDERGRPDRSRRGHRAAADLRASQPHGRRVRRRRRLGHERRRADRLVDRPRQRQGRARRSRSATRPARSPSGRAPSGSRTRSTGPCRRSTPPRGRSRPRSRSAPIPRGSPWGRGRSGSPTRPATRWRGSTQGPARSVRRSTSATARAASRSTGRASGSRTARAGPS